VRILHTSDWHIGRQFHNTSLLDQIIHIIQSRDVVASHRGSHTELVGVVE